MIECLPIYAFNFHFNEMNNYERSERQAEVVNGLNGVLALHTTLRIDFAIRQQQQRRSHAVVLAKGKSKASDERMSRELSLSLSGALAKANSEYENEK